MLDRAEWARQCVNRMSELTRATAETEVDNGSRYNEAFSDLICDLRHFADAEGLDFDEVVAGSLDTYNAEVAEEA